MHRITVPLPSGLHFVTAERVINSAHEQNVNIRHEDILQHVCLLYLRIVKFMFSTRHRLHARHRLAQTLPHAD